MTPWLTDLGRNPAVTVGGNAVPLLLAGPCVIESRDHVFRTAEAMDKIIDSRGWAWFFKASVDKANRTSGESFRGPGQDEGLRILDELRSQLNVPVITDVHAAADVPKFAEAVDVLQVPAFLCRQTDLVEACARAGKPTNIKKGQFLSPAEMGHVVAKFRAAGGDQVMACERGTTFGYHDLVVDFRGLEIMRRFAPVIYDATHSVQQPGAAGSRSGGLREHIPALARAAAAAGVSGFFMEVHPDPSKALSDAATQWPLRDLKPLLDSLIPLWELGQAAQQTDPQPAG